MARGSASAETGGTEHERASPTVHFKFTRTMEEPRKRARSDARLEEDAPAIKRASNETETAVGAGGGAPEEAEAAGAPSAPSRYVRREKLGEGSYGMVYRGEDLDDGSTVALKYIKVGEDQDGLPPTTLREVCVLRNLHHPNVVECVRSHPSPRLSRCEFLACSFPPPLLPSASFLEY